MNSSIKSTLLAFGTACLLATGLSCKKDEKAPSTTTTEPQTSSNKLSGHYVWKFDIEGIGSQESHLVFYTDSVGYVMVGPAYSTNYMMNEVSYTETEKRWIGIGKGGSIPKDGVYFVMFYKDITDSTVTVYKRECAGGLAEAQSFAYPEPNATEDHGWNVYHK